MSERLGIAPRMMQRGIAAAATMFALATAGCEGNTTVGKTIVVTPTDTPTSILATPTPTDFNSLPGPGATYTPTPYIITATPTPMNGSGNDGFRDIELNKGECVDVPGDKLTIVQGDVTFQPTGESVQTHYDNDAETGSLGKVFESGRVCAPWGADVSMFPTDHVNEFDQAVGRDIDQMLNRGCISGCRRGVIVWQAGN